MVVMSFFAAIDLGTTVVVAFSLGKLDPKRAREAARQSLMIMTLFRSSLRRLSIITAKKLSTLSREKRPAR